MFSHVNLYFCSLMFTNVFFFVSCKSVSSGRMKAPHRNYNNNNNNNNNNNKHSNNDLNLDYYDSSSSTVDDYSIFDLDQNFSSPNARRIPDEQRLLNKLLRGYDTAARPVFNASKPVLIEFGFSLIQIYDMDERNQILTTNVWLEQIWVDERLRWNKSDYNNLEKIRLPCNRIWLPDIVLYNSADDFTEGYYQSKAMVTTQGRVFWPPPVKLRSSCKIDVTFFPFDDQICQIKFGSWTYSGLQVDLTNKSNTTDLTNYIISGEWELKKVTVERNVAYYPCCPDEPYPDLIFYIHIRRRILYYLTNIIFPCVWLSILSVIGFWLPPDSGEKITLGITVLLAFSVFMLLIAENIPATSEMIPIICIYLTVTMSLTSLSIILTVLVLNLHHHGHHAPPIVPEKFYAYMTRQIAPTIGMMNIVKRFELNRFKVDKDLLNKSRIKVANWQDGNYNQFKKYDGSMMRCSCCLCFKSANNTNQVYSGDETTAGNMSILNEKKFVEKSSNKKVKLSHSSISLPPSPKQCHHHSQLKQNTFDHLNDSLDMLTLNLKSYLRRQHFHHLNHNLQNEWKLIARIVDRLLFWIFTFITFLSSLLLLVIVPLVKNKVKDSYE